MNENQLHDVKHGTPASAQDDAKEYGSPARILRQFLSADGYIAECDIPEICARLRPDAPAAGDAREVLTNDEILDRWDTHVGDSPITESDKLCFAREIEHDLLSKLSQRDAKDAARYRWWCDTGNDITSADTIGGKPTIDASIDAAMAASQQQEG